MPPPVFSPDRPSFLARLRGRRRRGTLSLRPVRRTATLNSRIFRAAPRAIRFFVGRRAVVISLLGILLGFGIGLISLSGYFVVKQVSISRGSLDVPVDQIQAAARTIAFGHLIFSVPTTDLAAQIQSMQPDISHVVIRRRLPDTLDIQVFKYQVIASIRVGTEDIVLNENGSRVTGAPATPDLLQLQLGEIIPLDNPAAQVVPPEHLATLRDAKAYYEATTADIITSIVYFPIAEEAHLRIQGGTELWVDLTQDVRAQLDKLSLAAKELDMQKKHYTYIDLRIRNKLFVKER